MLPYVIDANLLVRIITEDTPELAQFSVSRDTTREALKLFNTTQPSPP